MPNKKKDVAKEEIADRVDMKTLNNTVLQEEYQRGVRYGLAIGAIVFIVSLLFGGE